jgi:hypothetical protein
MTRAISISRRLLTSVIRTTATVALSQIAASLIDAPAAADEARPNRIRIEQVAPKNPEFNTIAALIREHRALETLQEIFAPFRLSADLTIKITECGMANAWYSRANVTICYEYLHDIRKTVPTESTPTGVTAEDAVVGQFFYVVAHEMGHAMFDQLNIPLFGRPEDAADQFAAYLMLRLRKSDARRLIGGAAFTYKAFFGASKITASAEAFADAHGAPLQRLYNLLCIAYGADKELFGDLVEKGYLPMARARSCRVEYGEIDFAFKQLIVPHVDKAMAEQVLAKSWLPEPGARRAAGIAR